MNKDVFLQTVPPEARAALAIAAEWRLISLLLERPRQSWHEHVRNLSREVTDPILLNAAVLSSAASEEDYIAILGPGGFATPREVGYAGFEDPGRMMADLQSFYTAFSYEPQAEDPTDHISVEAGFIGYIALKEAYAVLVENEEAAAVCREARQRFIEEHLVRTIRGLAGKLQQGGPAYLLETTKSLLKRVEGFPDSTVQKAAEDEGEVQCGLF